MRTENEHKTAILVFALSSKEELKCKKMSNAEALFRALSDQALKTVQKTGLPYFHISEKEQKGNCFGERFANAIQLVYDRGFDQIIAIGNDSPHLKASQILKSAKEIAAGKAVLGPSADGGFYLLGLHKTDFNNASFRNLPWQTSSLWDQFKAELGTLKVEVIELRKFLDIDNENDLKIILKFTKGLPSCIIKALLSMLLPNRIIVIVDAFILGLFQLDNHQSRGSPVGLPTSSI